MFLSDKLAPHFNSTLFTHLHTHQVPSLQIFSHISQSSLHFPSKFMICFVFCYLGQSPELSDAYSHEGSPDSEENKKGNFLSSNEFYIAPAPAKMGYGAAVKRFLKVMAMVWAGSQITKLVRAGGALTLTPFVDRGLSWFTHKFKFQTREGFHGNSGTLSWIGRHCIFGHHTALGMMLLSASFLKGHLNLFVTSKCINSFYYPIMVLL
ncbi:hypothetical protein HKD37_06G017620 [Glycine soja]